MKGMGARTLAALAIACALVPLSSTMLAVALPDLGRTFGRSPASLAPWLVTSYLVVSLLAQGPGGRLADRIGCGRALLIGQGIFASATALAVVAPGLLALAATRVLMAVGGAVMVPAAMSLLRDRTPPERRARAFGWAGSVMSVAAATGPVVGGALTQRFGWHAIFAANLPVLALSTLLLGRSAWSAEPSKERPTEGLVRSAARLMRLAVFAAGALTVALHNAVMYAVLIATPAMLSELRGVRAQAAGLTLLALTFGMAIGGPLGARISERVGLKAVVASGGLASCAGILLLRDVAHLVSPADAVPGLALVGLGTGVATASAQAAAVSSAGAAEGGLAAGLVSSLRYAGGVLGVGIVWAAHRVPAEAPAASHAHAITALLVPAALALPLALLLPVRPAARAEAVAA